MMSLTHTHTDTHTKSKRGLLPFYNNNLKVTGSHMVLVYIMCPLYLNFYITLIFSNFKSKDRRPIPPFGLFYI